MDPTSTNGASLSYNRCIVEDNYDFKTGKMSSKCIIDEMFSFTMNKYLLELITLKIFITTKAKKLEAFMKMLCCKDYERWLPY